jgi:hypothetical protein
MAVLGAVDLATLAIKAGWRGQGAARATAVMLAESSGDESAHNTRNGNDARGLMQINVKPTAHPEYTSRNLYDGPTNVATGYELWKKDGWQPWNSSRAGQALQLPIAEAAVLAAQAKHPELGLKILGEGPSLSQSAPPANASLLEVGANAIKFLTVGRNWGRIGMIVIGGIIVLIAVNTLTKPYTEPVAKLVTKGVL